VRAAKEEVAFVYGNVWKQRYFTKIGEDHFPLPVQVGRRHKAVPAYKVPTHGANWWGVNEVV